MRKSAVALMVIIASSSLSYFGMQLYSSQELSTHEIEQTTEKALNVLATNFEQNPIPCALSVVGFALTFAGWRLFKFINTLKLLLKDRLDQTTEHKPLDTSTKAEDSSDRAEQRAKDRITYAQLIDDYGNTKTRIAKIVQELQSAQIDFSYADKEVQEAEHVLDLARTKYANCETAVDKLQEEKKLLEYEIDSISLAIRNINIRTAQG